MEDTPKPFLSHLEELRSRLLKSLFAVALCSLAVYQWVDRFLEILARPVGHFVFLAPTEAFFVRLKIALVLGVITGMPALLYQAWRFVAVALEPRDRKSVIWLLPLFYILFLCGGAFGFFVLAPSGIRFLLSYGSPVLQPQLSVDSYVNFVGLFVLAMGAIFQMPLAAYFAGRLGVLTAEPLARGRRIAIVVIYAASAVLTPGPDPVTAILLALPSYLLYEASILAVTLAQK